MRVLVTGGNGFIGSNFIFQNQHKFEKVINIDNLSYAANADLNNHFQQNENYIFVKGSITDEKLLNDLLKQYHINCVINFAAETHVDRSINFADPFVSTNIIGTYSLLKASYNYLKKCSPEHFNFIQISTDEVYGALLQEDPAFIESSNLLANNPYSATKASAEMLCRSFYQTYKFPVIIVNCSNNYGPHQNSEKFIPKLIENAFLNKPLPLYGEGLQIRDWLYVHDNCEAIFAILQRGRIGEKYNIGGETQVTNLSLALKICELLDRYFPKIKGKYSEQLSFVQDRPGHDFRYDLDISKIKKELLWTPQTSLEKGLITTIKWHINKLKDKS